ncbi:MAG: RHS repeat-associated core domain-containing protein [Bacteroidetes bacterium]|nr:MAG: RHS repeat-associated core domain-containing protein [Bacteroidota bacterium]
MKTNYFSINYEKEVIGSVERHLHYIYSTFGLIAVITKQNSTETLYYTETDHLDSIIGLVTPEGSYAEKFSYDAWGRRRNPVDWTYDSIPTPTLIDRGFTGHEHLDKFDLINMNGRMYDPYIGRFLGVDPFIQFPGNSQSFNGYGYCLNNPLKYVDPSGYLFEGLGAWLRRVFGGDGNTNNGRTDASPSFEHILNDLFGDIGGGGGGNGGVGYYPTTPDLFGYYYLYQNGISGGGGAIGGNINYEGGGGTGLSITSISDNGFKVSGTGYGEPQKISIGNGKPYIIITPYSSPKERLGRFEIVIQIYGKMYTHYNWIQTVRENSNPSPYPEPIGLANFGFIYNPVEKFYKVLKDIWQKDGDGFYEDYPNPRLFFDANLTLCGFRNNRWEIIQSFSWGYSINNLGVLNGYFNKITPFPGEFHHTYINSTIRTHNNFLIH